MRYLILSDVHSNLEALEQCVELARGKYDEALCLGDIVGYGPDPNGVIDRMRELARTLIRGNHDKACCGITDAEDFNPLARQATLWTRGELSAKHLAFLRGLPQGPIIFDGFQIAHGSPDDEDEYIVAADTAVANLRKLKVQVTLFGHTHLQGGFMLTIKGGFRAIQCPAREDGCTLVVPLEGGVRYLINPGSVGQPRDGDWRAAFAILDEERREVEYYRTAYDLGRTQSKMVEAGLPAPLVARLKFGR